MLNKGIEMINELSNSELVIGNFINKFFDLLINSFPQAALAFERKPENLEDIKAAWTSAFYKEKLTEKMLENGLSQLRKSGNKFFPSLPEFIALCKKNPLIPNSDEVMSIYHRYIHHYSDDGSFDWKNNNLMYHIVLEIRKCNPLQNKLQDTLEMILREYTAKIEEGWVPSSPPEELPKPTKESLTPEQVEERRQSVLYAIQKFKTSHKLGGKNEK